MHKYLRLIGILLFVLILLKVNSRDVLQLFMQSDWSVLTLVALMNLLVVLLRSIRWVKLLEIQNYSFGITEAFWSYLRSLYFGNVTPGRVGELSRIHYLMKYVNINSAVATSGVIYDRILDTYFILILGVLGIVMSEVWVQYLWLKILLISFLFIIPIVLFVPKLTLTFASVLPQIWNL